MDRFDQLDKIFVNAIRQLRELRDKNYLLRKKLAELRQPQPEQPTGKYGEPWRVGGSGQEIYNEDSDMMLVGLSSGLLDTNSWERIDDHRKILDHAVHCVNFCHEAGLSDEMLGQGLIHLTENHKKYKNEQHFSIIEYWDGTSIWIPKHEDFADGAYEHANAMLAARKQKESEAENGQ